MATISDDVFTKELDGYLKAQKINKAERKVRIYEALSLSVMARDEILERERLKIPKKEIIPSEDTEQIEFVEWFRKIYPDIVIMAIWNGGTRTPGERTKQIAMGIHPGAADLFIPAWGLWVEMKRTKGYAWSYEQREFSDYCDSIGHHYFIGIGFEDAKEKILSLTKTLGFIDRSKCKNNLTK